MTVRRLAGVLLTAAGGAGVTACLMSAFTGMRDVMVTDGGACSSGGPYLSAHQCSGADLRLLMIGILGMLVSAGFFAAGTGLLGGRPATAGMLVWGGLFGALGWNFVHLGQHPPAAMNGGGGWLVTGAVFWVMAAGGVVPALTSLAGWLRRGSQPEPGRGVAPAVVARFPGMGGMPAGWQPGGGQFGMGGPYGQGGQSGAGGRFGAPGPNPGGGPVSLNIPRQEDSP